MNAVTAVPQYDADTEISVEDLHKCFGQNEVLSGIDLHIERGDLIAIVGGSGCGKTVLLNHILSQLHPDRGRVLARNHGSDRAPMVDLETANEQTLQQIHTHWGVVFQRNALFSGSVYDNIALWLDEVRHLARSDILPIAKQALQSVGLHWDQEFLDQDHASLSGGMAKRLAVARALVMDPKVLFYDEPTTGLDPLSAAQIQDLVHTTHFEGSHPNRTTIMITHDKDLLSRLQPRIVMLHAGRAHFDGPFEDFISADSSIIQPYFKQMPALHLRHPTSTP